MGTRAAMGLPRLPMTTRSPEYATRPSVSDRCVRASAVERTRSPRATGEMSARLVVFSSLMNDVPRLVETRSAVLFCLVLTVTV